MHLVGFITRIMALYMHCLFHLVKTAHVSNPLQHFVFNTLATGYGDFRTSVAKRRRRATEISVFPYGWMEEEFGFVMC